MAHEVSVRFANNLPTARKLPQPPAGDYQGLIGIPGIRQATEKNLAVAREHFLEADADNFDWHDETSRTRATDRATGRVYDVLDADALLADDARNLNVTCFCVIAGHLAFLRPKDQRSRETATRLFTVDLQAQRIDPYGADESHDDGDGPRIW